MKEMLKNKGLQEKLKESKASASSTKAAKYGMDINKYRSLVKIFAMNENYPAAIISQKAVVSLSKNKAVAEKDLQLLLSKNKKATAENNIHQKAVNIAAREAAPEKTLFLQADTAYNINQQYKEGIALFTQASRAGNNNAIASLARLYNKGQCAPADIVKAEKFATHALKNLKMDAKNHDKDAQFLLGYFYSNGLGIEKDHTQSLYWYKKAAENGHVDANYYYGIKYYYGDDVEANLRTALTWINKAIIKGSVNALYIKALVYKAKLKKSFKKDSQLEGVNVEKLSTHYKFLYKEAMAQGHAEAINSYVRKMETHREWEEGASTIGTKYGFIVNEGGYRIWDMTDKDMEADIHAPLVNLLPQECAVTYHTLGDFYSPYVREWGHNKYRLRLAHKNAPGKMSYPKAIQYYVKAAKQGHVPAMLTLGKLYKKGPDGLDVNVAEAKRWYSLASKQGSKKAKKALSKL